MMKTPGKYLDVVQLIVAIVIRYSSLKKWLFKNRIHFCNNFLGKQNHRFSRMPVKFCK